MKLRYKKIIAMVTVCTMGIGMVTFSITRQGQDKSTAVEKQTQTFSAYGAEESEQAADEPALKSAVSAASILPIDTPTPTEEAAVVAADTDLLSLESNPLEKSTNKEINSLITKYLNAKLSGKIEKFENIVDSTDALDIKDINRKTKYIDKYENVVCYTKKGLEDNSYVVYVYYDLKFASIETPAPGMNAYYIKTGEDGKLYIYLSEYDSKTADYLADLQNTEDVQKLIDTVNSKFKKALEKDTSLSEFYTKLEDSAKNVSMNE